MYSMLSSIRSRLMGTYHDHTYRVPTTVATRKNHFIRLAGSPLSPFCQKPGEKNHTAVIKAKPATHSGGNTNFMRTVSTEERVRGIVSTVEGRAVRRPPPSAP